MVNHLNRQRVISFLKRFETGDTEATLARCSNDIDVVANAPVDILPHMGHRRGKDEVRQMWKTIHGSYSSIRHELKTIVAEDDKVAVDMRAYYRKRANRRIVQFDMAAFYTLRNGRITHIREILDSFDLVQQVLERDLTATLLGNKQSDA
ncbi:nuclear transport factor 2 family protein [Bradyrhizobium sp. ARR65]|uniref:nuclear transport factor 2 family protein n=1 Tax=Bradyrhizobium sp. ARR65 TaxID=1040989 RepID=UPI0004640B5E|nr:nuclear transport factor 2 family protein [Bradyrhizobium sp. ARR65]